MDKVGSQALPESVAQERRALIEGVTGNGLTHVSHQGPRDGCVEDHRHLPGPHLAGAQPADHPAAGLAAHCFRESSASCPARRGEPVVALHGTVGRRHRSHGQMEGRGGILTGKALRIGIDEPVERVAELRALGVGNPLIVLQRVVLRQAGGVDAALDGQARASSSTRSSSGTSAASSPCSGSPANSSLAVARAMAQVWSSNRSRRPVTCRR